MSFVAIAPTLTNDLEVLCSGTAQAWGVIRYRYFVEQTNGLFISIDDATPVPTDIGGTACGTADFGEALEQLGSLLQNLFNAFPLQSVPDEDTIVVFVDGEQVSPTAGRTGRATTPWCSTARRSPASTARSRSTTSPSTECPAPSPSNPEYSGTGSACCATPPPCSPGSRSTTRPRPPTRSTSAC
jgi:hypothetical protein